MKRLTILLFILPFFHAQVYAQNCEMHLMVSPVEQGEEVTDGFNDMLMARLSNILAQQDIVADPDFSQFFITGRFSHFYKETLPGPPMQTAFHSTLTLYVGDVVNQQVYATESFEVRGVGNSMERALLNAMNSLNGKNQKVLALIEKGKKKILNYYDKNYKQLMQKAQRSASMNEYGEALYYLASIPECCQGYSEANSMMNKLFVEKLEREGQLLLQQAQTIYYAAPSPRGAAQAMQLLSLIDPDSPAQANAMRLAQEIRRQAKSDYDFETREKYKDALSLEKARIEAARTIGAAWGNGQKEHHSNLMFIR